MKPEAKKPVSISMTQALRDGLQVLADKDDRTFSDYVCRVLVRHTEPSEVMSVPAAKAKPGKKEVAVAKNIKAKLSLDRWPAIPDSSLLTDWYRAKKSAGGSVSQRAINGVGDELHKAVAKGFTVEECLTQAEGNKWKGFKAEWMKREEVSTEVQTDFVGTHTDTSWADGL